MRKTETGASVDGGPQVDHPRFSHMFASLTSHQPGRTAFDELRRAIIGQARGVTLEVGVGSGPNFAYYDPALVERVEATEPDATMLRYARERAAQAAVPITLTQAPVEALPFPDDTFDSAVMTLVFCSVVDPQLGLRELSRVLKPGGRLLMAEHVRSEHAVFSTLQTALVPVTTRLAGNCHWNRDTASVVRQSSFAGMTTTYLPYPVAWARALADGLLPILLIEATAPGA